MGSKARIAKHILPIMLEYRGNRTWVEPFVGGGNMIDKVSGPRIGADANKYTVEALTSIRDCVHELPRNNTEFTEDMYRQLRHSDDYKHKGFAGFAYSYGGKWLGGWSRNREGFDYVAWAHRKAVEQSPLLQGVNLLHCNYAELGIPPNSLIYCDPPYEGTAKYHINFDHADFWQWCRVKASEGHKVFVSEYNAPDDFICLFEVSLPSSLNGGKGGKRGAERLFTPFVFD